MRIIDWIFAAIVCGVAASTSGCAITNSEGFEVYNSIGIRAVDAHQESSSTHTQCGGLRGWFNGSCTEAVK